MIRRRRGCTCPTCKLIIVHLMARQLLAYPEESRAGLMVEALRVALKEQHASN